MTNTTITPAPDNDAVTEAERIVAEASTRALWQAGHVYHVDPSTVEIEVNVRDLPELDPQFVASVAEHGVLLPVIARVSDDGARLVVRDGQMRTLAARQVGAENVPTIPVYVTAQGDDAVSRISTQLVTNDHRQDLTDAQRFGAWQQLAVEGLSEDAIAQRVSEAPERVAAGLTVARSKKATAAAAKYDLTLDDTLLWTEFAGDRDAIATLDQQAKSNPAQLQHAAQRIRDNRAYEAERTRLLAELDEAGITVIDAPVWGDRTPVPLNELTNRLDTFIPIERAAHIACPGHVAWLRPSYQAPEIVYGCTSPVGRHRRKSAPAPLTDAQRAERREVIENNKAMDAAQKVRRQFVTTLLTRKTAPKGAAEFVARVMIEGGYELNHDYTRGMATARELFGLPKATGYYTGSRDLTKLLTGLSGARAQVVTLGIAIAGIESTKSKTSWRRADRIFALYLTKLATWGYTLAGIEAQVAATAKK